MFSFVIALYISALFATSNPSGICVYKLKNGKFVPSEGCTNTEPDHGSIMAEMKARIQAKAAKTKVVEESTSATTTDEATIHDHTSAPTPTNAIMNDASTIKPSTAALQINQTARYEEIAQTTPPTKQQLPQDTHILLGRRSSLSLISLLATNAVHYKVYGINVTHLIAVDYDPVDQYIYWTERTLIRRAKANFTEGQVLVSNLSNEVDGIAVDWVARNMYWSDKPRQVIEVSRLDGSAQKSLINTDIEAPRAIALYPAIGRMYWSDWGSKPKIEVASLNGEDRQILVNASIFWPNGLAIDYTRGLLYWVDSYLDKIEAITLEGKLRTVLLAHGHHIFGFTYWNNFLYWTDWQTHSLDRALVYNTTIRQNVASGATDFMGIKAYGNQPIPQTNDCAANNGGCSHLCLYTPKGAKCDCQEGWSLNTDNKTC